ncbi:MAG: HDOD domain-containing protein [Gammaproteobacteria bacterium]
MNGEIRRFDSEENMKCYQQLVSVASNVLKTDVDCLQMISTAALKLLKLTQDADAHSSDLAEIIQTEPSLAAKVLQAVNSAGFSLPNRIQSLNHAIGMLGFSEIRRIATEQLLFSQLLTSRSDQRFEPLFFWQHCLFVACLSKQIAVDLDYSNPEILYTAGLLHDIGKLVFENHGKVTYSDFLSSSDKSDSPTDHNERSFFGLTHTEIGHVFCVKWNLPEVITAAVAFHHDLAPAYTRYAEYNYETAILSFSNYVAWLHGIGSSKGEAGHDLPFGVLKLVDFRRLNFESLFSRVDEAMARTGQFYGIIFPDIQTLRASLVFSVLSDGHEIHDKGDIGNPRGSSLASLISPHRSLDPQQIVLSTLQAIHEDFGFERVMMLGMSPDRQALITKQGWPKHVFQPSTIPFEAIGGQLLRCLRNRTPVIINQSSDVHGARLTRIFETMEFIAAPVLRNKRLIGVLYADYCKSKRPISQNCLSQILPVTNELGLALSHAKTFNVAKRKAEMDSLTQLYNRGKLNDLLDAVYNGDKSELKNFAIGFVDIDHFKRFNDLCGHQAGDDVLRIAAEILHSLSRQADFIGRYGGEEFLFALRHTNSDGAYDYADRMRQEIEKRGKILSCRFSNLVLTVSIGIAMYNPGFQNYVEHVAMADQAMYQAKSRGRNRVVLIN